MTSSENSIQLNPIALTIAGFDPSGGAGVLADVRTFAAFGLRASAAITSITFQNTTHVFGTIHQSGKAVRDQVVSLLDDNKFVCAKIGMLPTREVVQEVARLFRETNLPAPVVDPVMISTSGHRLMDENALDTFVSELLPLAGLVTPNISEAEALTGLAITSEGEMRKAAAVIRHMGARAVLIKGGHLGESRRHKAEGKTQKERSDEDDPSVAQTSEAIDLLDHEGKVTIFSGERIRGAELHGSGCILSAAIAAGLGKGMTLEDSVSAGKTFVLEAIRNSSIEAP